MFAALFASALQTTALAAECEFAQDPPPQGGESTGIAFYNETQFAFRVLAAGMEDGFLSPMSEWIQPGETQSFGTLVGQTWFVEINTPDGPVCSGAISANSTETCQMRVLYDGGIGYDAGFCDFQP